LNETVGTVKPLKSLIGEPDVETGVKGSRLIAAGIALIAFPDPTITDLAGVTMVTAGLIKNKMTQTTAADGYREFRDAIERIRSISQELVY